jgi:hypothetical protein
MAVAVFQVNVMVVIMICVLIGILSAAKNRGKDEKA